MLSKPHGAAFFICLVDINSFKEGIMLNIEEPKEEHTEIFQNASVYIPVEVTSCADPGEIKTFCCGEPTVSFCGNHRNGKYCFTIIQPICVEVPIELSAEALLGNLHVKWGEETDTVCEPVCEEADTVCEEVDTVCEEVDTVCESVFVENVEISSPEPEQPKPSPSKNWYKVYF
jgi:hypothetical protein